MVDKNSFLGQVMWLRNRKWDVVAFIMIFCLSLFLRLEYQRDAEVRNHIISDAKEYFLGAYNLRFFGLYSTSPPKGKQPPQPNAGRTPGYSLFLLPFIYMSKTIPEFLNRVMATQAILGSLTAAFAFLTARLALPLFWAFAAGLLTSLSPHLIAMDDYLLTESLFTFVTMIGFYCFVLSCELKGKRAISSALVSGVFFGFSFLVKPMTLLLGPFMATVYLIVGDKQNIKKIFSKREAGYAVCFLSAFIIAISPYFIRNKITLNAFFPESGRGWGSIVDGTYINLTFKNPRYYGYPYRDDPLNHRMQSDKDFFFETIKKRIAQRPFAYLRWYFGGKILCAWRWNVVTGHHDVYVYPMKRFGFHVNQDLLFVHNIMQKLHWPIFWIAISAPLVLGLFIWQKNAKVYFYKAVPYLFIISYFFVIVTFMFPIPRYFIPIRPYMYNLAILNVYMVFTFMFLNYRKSHGGAK